VSTCSPAFRPAASAAEPLSIDETTIPLPPISSARATPTGAAGSPRRIAG
jgi:hypothetical protein